MRTEEEIRKMLKTAIKHPERFNNAPISIETLRWVLNEVRARALKSIAEFSEVNTRV